MGVHLQYFIDKPVNVEGEVKWERIDHNIGELYSTDLYAWLAGVRNHNNFIPIAPWRGVPPDMADQFSRDYWDSDLGGDQPDTWVMASEILQALDNFQPILFNGAIGRSQYHRWDKKSKPDCYSRHFEPAPHRKIFSMDSDQVKRESGYLSELYQELGNQCVGSWISRPKWQEEKEHHNWRTGEKTYTPAGWVVGRTYRVKANKLKHRMKLQKYAKRTGNYDIHVKWTLDFKGWNEANESFLNELRKLYSKHGDVRMVMSFN